MKKSKKMTSYIRSLTEEISEKENRKLEKWLAASSHNRKICDDLRKTWFLAEPPVFESIPDMQNEWSRLEHSLELKSRDGIKATRIRRFILDSFFRLRSTRFRPVLVVVASLLIVISALFIWKNPFSQSRNLELVTQHGERSQMILSDGSEIRLNSGSMARFRKSFSGHTREVFLTGEAFFKVTKEERPFVVVTGNAKTMVLGTQFNVWARDGETRVVVRSGRVKLSSTQSENQGVVLQKDQMCSVSRDDSLLTPKAINSRKALGWLQGKLIFEKIPLMEILNELERSYNVLIEIPNSDLHSRTLTATFDHRHIDTVLTSICLTLGTDYYFDKGRFVIID